MPMKNHQFHDQVLNHQWEGSGTHEDPYLVEFLPADPENPKNFSNARKWFYTATVTVSVFVVTFISSAYSGTLNELEEDFGSSEEVLLAGISLFVLGFALGPCFWAPLSELYGRRVLYWTTLGCLTAVTAGAAGSNSMATLLVLRFLGGTFGASPCDYPLPDFLRVVSPGIERILTIYSDQCWRCHCRCVCPS